ncbi:MAG: hypothetical protein WHS65_13460 [Melioribacteraceae bacterium]
MNALSQIFIGAFLLSIVHASTPNHWIQLVALSKAEKWNEKSTELKNITTIIITLTK